jgi:hypothetical protein
MADRLRLLELHQHRRRNVWTQKRQRLRRKRRKIAGGAR